MIAELRKGLDEKKLRGEGAVSELNRGFLSRNLPLDPNVHHLRGFQDFKNKMKRDVDYKNIYMCQN